MINLIYGSRRRLQSIAIGQVWRPDAGTTTTKK